jgi:hypothetical protein
VFAVAAVVAICLAILLAVVTLRRATR